MSEESKTSGYWLDLAVAEIIAKYPKGEIIVSSGISPSASYHVGHFRETLTADALRWGLQQAGRQARHLHFADNFDPLRKRYHFLPERFEEFVGQPICLIPDPFDCHENYAKHYYLEFEESARQMGVEMTVVPSYEEQYLTGKMAPYIEQVLEKLPVVRTIFEEVSGRALDDDWAPIQVLGEDNRFFNARPSTWDKAAKTIEGKDYTKGQAKLNWRLDWPARWALWGVDVEPFGRELATKGGAYDTGRRFAKEVFDVQAPFPIPYDTINLLGDTKKMSSSLGNLVTPEEALQIMPAEVLRYFIVRSKPDRTLYFDPGLGFYNLIDEYSKIAAGENSEFKEAYEFASAIAGEPTVAKVPFNHLVSAYQAAQGDTDELKAILKRTDHKFDDAVVEREIPYVKNWLDKYAPDNIKFTVQDKLPQAELTESQKDFLSKLAEAVESNRLDGQAMHEAIYAAKEAAGLKPQEAFQALYRVILGQDFGPKAGWFLSSLDQDWLVKRLKLEG